MVLILCSGGRLARRFLILISVKSFVSLQSKQSHNVTQDVALIPQIVLESGIPNQVTHMMDQDFFGKVSM